MVCFEKMASSTARARSSHKAIDEHPVKASEIVIHTNVFLQVHDSSAAAPRSNIRRQVNNEKITAQENKAAPHKHAHKRRPRVPERFNGPAAHAGADAHSGPAVGVGHPATPRLYTASAGRRSWKDFFVLSMSLVKSHMHSLPTSISQKNGFAQPWLIMLV